MPANSKKQKAVPFFYAGDTVNENMRDYSNEPFFKQKTEESKNTLDRVGFPKELLEKIKKGPAK